MRSWFSGPRELVGLDIGSSSVKLVQLRPTRSTYRLVALGMAPVRPETIMDGAITDASTLSNTIRQLFEDNHIAIKDVAISVSGHSVIIKKITIPQMKQSELQEAITWEAEQHIPYSMADVNIDFQVLGNAGNGKGDMDVLLVAVKKDTMDGYLGVVSAAGLRAVVVDVDAFAVENAFGISETVKPDEVVALVNVGAAVTNINVIRGGVSDFTRDSALAGNRHTEALQKTLSVSYEQAEALKIGEPVQGHTFEEAKPLIEMADGDLASEIRRSFEFYRSNVQGGVIERLSLSGGCALLPDLSSHLSKALELPVEIANPFRKIIADPKKFDPEYLSFIAPQMAVAVGLAVREPGDAER